ncbi:hypothetical protein GS682_28570 [Nostoc sp. B(2019)]|nr:hypothetical protein [Nostoc sp. B(2019)]
MEKRVQQILADLERVQENLLALSDDIWLNIDHNDSQALQKGFEFKLVFNQNLDNFNQNASDISQLIEQFTNIHIEVADIAQKGTPEHERITQELDTTQPYTVDENFTYKRPYGFILQGQAYKGINTWRYLYELFCKQLAAKDIKRFQEFVDSPDAKTVRGGVFFSRDKSSLRKAIEINSGICAEGNLSANAIRDRIKFMLSAFEIELGEFSLYLREDRNAAE